MFVNCGYEAKEGRSVCRWMVVWEELKAGEIAGCVGGYSGGGSFQLEQFYAVLNEGKFEKCMIDLCEKVSGAEIDFFEDVPANASDICNSAQDVFCEWNIRDEWEESEQLLLVSNPPHELVKEDDMLLYSTAYADFIPQLLEWVGITARPAGK